MITRAKSSTHPTSLKRIPALKERRKFLGAHVSAAKGLDNAIYNMKAIKGTACSFFLKGRTWSNPPLRKDVVSNFRQACADHNVRSDMIMPHAQYIINLAQPAEDKRNRAVNFMIDDLKRCQTLGISLYNIHPGSTTGACSRDEGIGYIASAINLAHSRTESVVIVLENMANTNNSQVIGGRFEDFRDIIQLVEDKTRVGVCLDTCHLFAAGYDMTTAENYRKTWDQFDIIVGASYLRAMHVNDSKTPLGSSLDRHENIGKGKIPMSFFEMIMNDDRFDDLPMILETPVTDKNYKDVLSAEIQLLHSLCRYR